MIVVNMLVSPLRRGVASRVTAALTLAIGLLSLGCGRNAAPTAEKAAAEVALCTVDSRGLSDAIQRHRGKVVLVDFWATWCVPCVELFPHTVDLQRRFADRGLAVISVSMDDPTQRGAVLHFLRNHRAAFDNFISSYGVGSEGFDAFGVSDGALPHVRLYDRNGQVQKTFLSGGQSLAHQKIEAAVEELLGK
jgi:thiol-disulfide isomerase/thioredoxin